MTVLPALLALLGFLIIVILGKRNVKGNVLLGIVITAVLYYVFSGTVPSFDITQIGQSFKDFADIGVTGSIPICILEARIQSGVRRRCIQCDPLHHYLLLDRHVRHHRYPVRYGGAGGLLDETATRRTSTSAWLVTPSRPYPARFWVLPPVRLL